MRMRRYRFLFIFLFCTNICLYVLASLRVDHVKTTLTTQTIHSVMQICALTKGTAMKSRARIFYSTCVHVSRDRPEYEWVSRIMIALQKQIEHTQLCAMEWTTIC